MADGATHAGGWLITVANRPIQLATMLRYLDIKRGQRHQDTSGTQMKKLLLIPVALIALGTLGASYAGRSAHSSKASQSAQYWHDPLAKKYLFARKTQVPKAAHYLFQGRLPHD
jgi:hypothetical protein